MFYDISKYIRVHGRFSYIYSVVNSSTSNTLILKQTYLCVKTYNAYCTCRPILFLRIFILRHKPKRGLNVVKAMLTHCIIQGYSQGFKNNEMKTKRIDKWTKSKCKLRLFLAPVYRSTVPLRKIAAAYLEVLVVA